MADAAQKKSPASYELFPQGQLFVGAGDRATYLELSKANRHGLIAGATGTGKTVTLQTLAEGFSHNGVPVFMADVKGDLAGISTAGDNPKMTARAETLGLTDFSFNATPSIFWDIFGTSGHPVRVTVSEVGPILFARLMDLSDAQEGVLTIAFQLADDDGLLLLDLEDLQALLVHVAENAKALSAKYGNVSSTTVAAIQRKLLQMKQEGAESLFGEPALDINDLMRTDREGKGLVSILAADVLIQKPRVYAVFLLWLLSELFEQLPEAGDLDRPKLVFFFDEAHLLFTDAPKPLLQKIEQVVRLIRSKGVGVYFVTQQPQDIPDAVLAQLGNRVQHALRAFTPADQKAVKAAATSFRANPAFTTVDAITNLGVGEALVSFLQADGTPSIVERVKIRPPMSRLGPLTMQERNACLRGDAIGDTYDTPLNRESAYEKLTKKRDEAAKETPSEPAKRGRPTMSTAERIATAAVRTATSSIGRQIGNALIRGVLGSLKNR